jgi:hypothetical protein
MPVRLTGYRKVVGAAFKEMNVIDKLITDYVKESAQTRVRMQNKLFSIFTETTGYMPQDLCLVEQQVQKGVNEYTTVYFFDWKHRYMEVVASGEGKTK